MSTQASPYCRRSGCRRDPASGAPAASRGRRSHSAAVSRNVFNFVNTSAASESRLALGDIAGRVRACERWTQTVKRKVCCQSWLAASPFPMSRTEGVTQTPASSSCGQACAQAPSLEWLGRSHARTPGRPTEPEGAGQERDASGVDDGQGFDTGEAVSTPDPLRPARERHQPRMSGASAMSHRWRGRGGSNPRPRR